jgi:hypothetical protein
MLTHKLVAPGSTAHTLTSVYAGEKRPAERILGCMQQQVQMSSAALGGLKTGRSQNYRPHHDFDTSFFFKCHMRHIKKCTSTFDSFVYILR